jgi:glycosyltransferase involved in cell wall biosynthesis
MSKVLLHSLVFSPDGVSTSYLMTELALELKRMGHQVTVLTTTPHYNVIPSMAVRHHMRRCWLGLLYYSEIDGIQIWHVKVPNKGDRVWMRVFDYIRFHAVSLLAAVIKIETQDIVIATSPPLTMAVISWLLGVLWKAPSVYKVAELYPDVAIRQGIVKNRGFIVFLNWLEKFVYKKNTLIVAIAEQFMRVIRKRGVPDYKLQMIPDFVDTKFYCPKAQKNDFSLKYDLLKDFIVLYAGNIGIVQDWDSVLFAAENLSKLAIRFVVVGDGSKRDWLEKEIEDRKLKNVTLLGYQPKEFMPEINASCDISIIPMNMAGSKDGVPSKIYSIFSCAKSVIALVDDESELRWIVEQSGCGRSVSIGDRQGFSDAILKAFNERELLPVEGLRGRAYVEANYSKEAIANKYHELIAVLQRKVSNLSRN